jgi:hypothetical protein
LAKIPVRSNPRAKVTRENTRFGCGFYPGAALQQASRNASRSDNGTATYQNCGIFGIISANLEYPFRFSLICLLLNVNIDSILTQRGGVVSGERTSASRRSGPL